jgi:hypothetical protein
MHRGPPQYDSARVHAPLRPDPDPPRPGLPRGAAFGQDGRSGMAVKQRASRDVGPASVRMLLHLGAGLVVATLLVGLVAREAYAHVPPPVTLEGRILGAERATEQAPVAGARIQVDVVLQVGLFRDWFGVELRTLPAAGPVPETLHAAIAGKLAAWLQLRVDGLLLAPALTSAQVESFRDHGQDFRFVRLVLDTRLAQAPQQVAIAWRRYADDTNFLFDEIALRVEAGLASGGGQPVHATLRPEEPEYVWHRPPQASAPTPLVLPAPRRAPHVSLGAVALALEVLALLWLVVLLRRREGPAPRGWIVLWVLGALLVWPLASVEVPLPWGGASLRPDEAEAAAIYASLQQGVYAALDEPTQEAVYDRLAVGVSAELLPRLYLDLNESLILREEGGAVARVTKTEILGADLLPAGDVRAPWFRVHARWRVTGEVGHWGHTHQRVNEYLADVTIIADGEHWKLAAIDVLDEIRR